MFKFKNKINKYSGAISIVFFLFALACLLLIIISMLAVYYNFIVFENETLANIAGIGGMSAITGFLFRMNAILEKRKKN